MPDVYQDLLENVVCNLCGQDDYDVVYPARYEDADPAVLRNTFRSSGDEMLLDQVVCCRHCGLKYLTPRLREDFIMDAYSSGEDEAFVSQCAGREKTFERCLDVIESYVPHRGTILDIGTAGGSFLHVAEQRGWDVRGCEPNKWLTQWGAHQYGLQIDPGTVFDMQLADRSFDVITLWDVLEHTPDPQRVLLECHRLLKPQGVLAVNYPDIDSLPARTMGRRWVFLLTVHLYYFSPKTIRSMFDRVGFEIIRKSIHWQSLELDYVLKRMQPYIPLLPGMFRKLFRMMRLQNIHVRYWMGQTLVLGRKIRKPSE